MKKKKCQLCQKKMDINNLHSKIALIDKGIYRSIKEQFKNIQNQKNVSIKLNLVENEVELYETCDSCLNDKIFSLTNDLFKTNKIILEVAEDNEDLVTGTISIQEDINYNECYCCKTETSHDDNRNVVIYVKDEFIKMLKTEPNLFFQNSAHGIQKIMYDNTLTVNVCNSCVKNEIKPKIELLEEYGITLAEFSSENEENADISNNITNNVDNDDDEIDESEATVEEMLLAFGDNLMSPDNIAKMKRNMIYGRDKEVDSLINILSKRDKNNPIIIGEPGVGKTSLVHKLCLKIHEGKVPVDLKDVKIFEVKISDLIAGTRFRGDLEEKLNEFLYILKDRKDIIIFFDEIHQLVGAGKSATDSINVKDVLKPALSKGELTCIGATTFDEYKMTIEVDSALKRRFQPIQVKEPTHEECVLLLKQVKKKYEKHHAISIKDKLLEEIVYLSNRYITDRFLPDKALDLLDQACALLKVKNDTKAVQAYVKKNKDMIKHIENKNFEHHSEKNELVSELQQINKDLQKDLVLTSQYIYDVLNDWTGIDVSKLNESDLSFLQSVEEKLSSKVIGQKHVTDVIAKYIKRARLGLNSASKPIGVHLLVGPTGTGKTELAKITSELFTSGIEPIRFDLSEYSKEHEVSKLIGSPPGYIGHEEGGLLTEKVKRNPFSVILLDEIEKAHPDILNILLQVFDEGFLTDGRGQKVDFKNTMIFMTSNIIISSNNIKKPIGFNMQDVETKNNSENKKLLETLVEKGLRKELLNRIDEILLFNELSEDTLHNICINKMDAKIKYIVKTNKYVESCEYDESVIKFITKNGFNKEYGARPLNRAIERHFSDSISDFLIQQPLTKNKKYKLKVTINEEKLVVSNK